MCVKRVITLLIAVIMTSACFADTVFVHSTLVIPDSVLVKSVNVGMVKHPFWDNLPSIIALAISGFLSLAALTVAYINTKNTIKAQNENFEKQLKAQEENLKNQLKTQLATTVEKEWIQDVRGHLTTILYNSFTIAQYNEIKNRTELGAERLEQRNIKSWEYYSSKISLSILLNGKNEEEKKLLEAIQKLTDKMNGTKSEEDLEEIISLNDATVKDAHKLFDSKKV